MQLLGECVTNGAPICLASFQWALRWRGTDGDYAQVARHLPDGNFGHTVGGEHQSFFFRLHGRSAFVLVGDHAKYVVDVVASDPEDPLPRIWNEIELPGERVAHIHFDHSLLVFSLATNMSRELSTHFAPSSAQSIHPAPPFYLFPAAGHGYGVYFREVWTGPVDYRVLALQEAPHSHS
jgi:hypothetical protein